MNNVWSVILKRPCVATPSTPRTLTSELSLTVRTSTWRHQSIRDFTCSRHLLLPSKVNRSKPATPVKTPKTKHLPKLAGPQGGNDSVVRSAPAIRIRPQDIQACFGSSVQRDVANEVLTELQRRRTSGSLIDVGVDVKEVADEITIEQASKALQWLRSKYPVDEALAAEEYANIQEDQYRKDFEEKALNSRLYAREKDDKADDLELEREEGPWDEMRLAKWKEQMQKIEALEKEYGKEQEEVRLVLVQHQVELAQRRDEKLMHWDELEKKAELDTDQLMDESRSAASRLGMPLAFGLISILGVSLFINRDAVAQPQVNQARDAWTKPSLDDLSPSVVTCAAITAINLALLLAWRLPRAWYTMNRLFLLSAGNPNTFSVLGSVFSHQRWIMHLAANSALLFSIGMPLHDEIGRNNFLAVYLASGIFASCASLGFHVLRRNFLMASLGASGAVMGLFGAYFVVQPTRDIFIPFVTDRPVAYDSWYAIAAFLALELFMFVRTKGARYDHVSHVAGLAAGVVYGRVLRPKEQTVAERVDYAVQVNDSK